MKVSKKALKRMQKILNTLVIFMMIVQPVSAPGVLRAMAAETPIVEVALPPVSAEVEAISETVAPIEAGSSVATEEIKSSAVEDEVVVEDERLTVEAPVATEEIIVPAEVVVNETDAGPVAEEKTTTAPGVQTVANTEIKKTDSNDAKEAVTEEIWSVDGRKATINGSVKKGVKYVAPQNDQVSVTFTKLPENAGKLSIEKVTLTKEQVRSLKALSNEAYDITSDMADGTFEYVMTLPIPKGEKEVQIKFAEDAAGLAKNAEIVSAKDVDINKNSVSATLDHFTIFAVATYADIAITIPKTIFARGEMIYAEATVSNGSYYKMDIDNPSGVTQSTSGCQNSITSINDSFDIYNNATISSNWRVVVNEYANSTDCSNETGAISTASVNFEVTKAVATTTLISDNNPADEGEFVTLTATVAGTAQVPSGTVTFSDGVIFVDGSLDGAGVASVSTNLLAVGTHNITATYNGNVNYDSSISNTLIQTISDITPPVIVGTPTNFTVEANVASGAIVNYANPTATDNFDAVVTVTCAPSSGSFFPMDSTTVTCDASDAAGNWAEATNFDVLVEDTIAPVSEITSPIADSFVSGTVDVRGTVLDFNPHHYYIAIKNSLGVKVAGPGTINDATSFTDKSLFNWNTTLLPDGVYSINLEARDAANNKDAGSVSIKNVTVDNTKPIINLVGDNPQTIEGGAGSVYSELGAIVTDNIDAGLVATVDASAVNTMIVGTYPVTYDAVDQAGNVAVQVTRTVNVVDTTAPVISGATNQIVEMDSVSGAIVTYGITATDAVDGPLPVTCAPVSGSVFAYGTTSAICSATDADGNNATASFNVTVQDTTGPIDVAIAYSPINFSNATSIDITYSIGSDFSNLNLATGRIQKRTGDVSGSACVNWGAWTNLVYETDGSYADSSIADEKCYRYRYVIKDNVGNQSISAVAGTVKIDQSAPVISGFGDIVIEATNPAGDVANFSPTAADNVDGIVAVVCAPASGSTFPIGDTTVSCEAEDSLGNKSTETFVVTVQDTTAPTIDNVADIIEEATSSAGAVATFVEPMSHDAVDGDLSATCDAVSGAIFALGATIVTCTKTDSAGNAATPETFTITVQDTTAPIIALNGDNPQTVERKAAYVEVGAAVTDNYDTALVVTIDASAVDVNVAGAYLVYYDVTDTAGNMAVQVVRTVNVVDTIDPVVTFDDETNPADGLLTSNANQTFAVAVDEDVTTCQLNFGSSTVTTATSQITWNHSFPEDTGGSWHFYSPIGTDYAFPDRYANAGPGGNSWVAPVVYDMSSVFAGEQMGGTWQLSMNDHVGWDSGAITAINLVLNGQNYPWNGWAGIWDYHTTTVDIPVTGGSGGPSSGVYDMTVVHDGDSATASVNLPEISDGAYEYTITCTDLSDNDGTSETRDVTIDTTAPSLSAKTTFEGWYNTDQTSVFNYIDINGIASGDNPECVISTEGVGQTCSVVPNVCDVVGNCNTDEVTSNGANIDKSNPEVNAGADKQTNAEFTQDATASDSISGIATYAWTQESGPGSVTFGTFDAEDTTVSADTDGTYVFRLMVTDNANNSAFDEFTLIWDTTKPVITRTGDDPITIEYAGTYTEQGATWTDVVDGAGNATVGGDTVNTLALGTYIITYDYTDVAGNVAEQVIRTVKIVDTTAPVVALNGGDVSFRRGRTYHEQGATWTDNVDGSGNVATITGTVNENRRGTYYLTYSYTDSSGNESSVVRKIVVKKQSADDNGGGGGNNNDDTQGAAGSSTGGGAGTDEETLAGENAGEEGTENTGTENGGQPEVKGAETGQVLGEEIIAEEDSFWSFSWWWLLIFVLAGFGLYRITRRRI